LITVDDLTKEFPQKEGDNLKAVDNLSFSASAGEIVVLLGVNGAGKTTTMRMLSTVLQPTSGKASVCGYDLLKSPQEIRRRLGFLSGDTGLYRRLTARELITYFGKLYDMKTSRIKERMELINKMLDMHDFLDKKIDSLSTGMRQKVSIARSIIHDPPVMIFDEATAGLDILTAKNIISFIHSCKTEGKCVLFSTHIMREAERIADRIVMIHQGRLLKQGSWAEMKEDTGKADLDDIFIDYVSRCDAPKVMEDDELD